jgi:predicted nucleic acid-binding OB-fold protein
MEKEEHGLKLEYLTNGYPLERKMVPIVQAIGKNNLTLLELVPMALTSGLMPTHATLCNPGPWLPSVS